MQVIVELRSFVQSDGAGWLFGFLGLLGHRKPFYRVDSVLRGGAIIGLGFGMYRRGV